LKVFRAADDLRRNLDEIRGNGCSVGLVPTMGALHDGHLSLIHRAASNHEAVVVSIFVNPLQFSPSEDFENYPRDAERDKQLAEGAGATHLFIPTTVEMDPAGEAATQIEVGRIGEVCEGKYRPGHFSGVATICVKLFNTVQPQSAYFGKKDAQQLAVIRQVVRDLNIPIRIMSCPTVRDADGLALSSRNEHLNNEQTRAAAILFRSLSAAADLASNGERSAKKLIARAKKEIEAERTVALEYLEIVDPSTFEPLEEVGVGSLAAVATHVGPVRLIDNIELPFPPRERPG